MNTTEQPTTTDNANDELQAILEMVRDMMGELFHQADIGAHLNKLNISTEWADEIKAWFKSPVILSYESLQNLEESIRAMIHVQFMDFLQDREHLIDKIYLVAKSSLHYAIILKEDSIPNEAEIIGFKMNYDSTPVSDRFPLIISFVDSEDLEGANIEQELSFG